MIKFRYSEKATKNWPTYYLKLFKGQIILKANYGVLNSSKKPKQFMAYKKSNKFLEELRSPLIAFKI